MKTFSNVNEAVFTCLKSKLQAQGLNLSANSGYLSKNGISLDYAFDPAAATLSVSNLEVGFPATMLGMNTDKVMGILETAISDCQG